MLRGFQIISNLCTDFGFFFPTNEYNWATGGIISHVGNDLHSQTFIQLIGFTFYGMQFGSTAPNPTECPHSVNRKLHDCVDVN